MNRGVALSRAPRLCLMIDGARLVTPGVLSWGMRLLELSPRAMVEVRGWHLGPKWQPESVMEGYDLEQERELLESVCWPENGLSALGNCSGDSPNAFRILSEDRRIKLHLHVAGFVFRDRWV